MPAIRFGWYLKSVAIRFEIVTNRKLQRRARLKPKILQALVFQLIFQRANFQHAVFRVEGEGDIFILEMVSHLPYFSFVRTCKLDFYCATQICIARTCYGDVAGWLDVRHTPVLYQNG